MPNQQLSERIRRIIAHLQEAWQQPQPISPDDLKRITEFIVALPEQYKQTGLAKIAGYATNTMSLHILNLLAIFQQYAEQEGISASNMEETLKYILPDTFRVLSDLDSQVRVQSLDDVAALTNITTNLQVLSSSDTAEEAQSWLYELPTMYYQQLSQEKLTMNTYASTYIPEQQSFASAPVMTPSTFLVTEPTGSFHTFFVALESKVGVQDNSDFVALESKVGVQDNSEENKLPLNDVLAA